MKTLHLLILVFTCVSLVNALQLPSKGIYSSLDELKNSTPSSQKKIILKEFRIKGKHSSPQYSPHIEVNGEVKRWRNKRDGILWAYCDGKTIFIKDKDFLTKLNETNGILWFMSLDYKTEHSLSPTGGAFGNPYSGGQTKRNYFEKVKVVDPKKGKPVKLSVKVMKGLLSRTPKLLEEYKKRARVDINPPTQQYFFKLLETLEQKQP